MGTAPLARTRAATTTTKKMRKRKNENAKNRKVEKWKTENDKAKNGKPEKKHEKNKKAKRRFNPNICRYLKTSLRLGDSQCAATIVECKLGSAHTYVPPWFCGGVFVSSFHFISSSVCAVSGADNFIVGFSVYVKHKSGGITG